MSIFKMLAYYKYKLIIDIDTLSNVNVIATSESARLYVVMSFEEANFNKNREFTRNIF